MDDFRDKLMGFLIILSIIMILIVIFVSIAFSSPEQECEKVTWYEYGEKKTGVICGEAKAQMESIREEMGIYKKKE
tara:strand:- start:207 stop:434 length:228 start_codon:yes stop_codon:yes gene_type:complete